MLKSTLFALALAAAGVTAASAQDYRAQSDFGFGGHGYGQNRGYQGSDGGLGRYCPPGYYPHSAPSSNGIRCEPPGDTTEYISPRLTRHKRINLSGLTS